MNPRRSTPSAEDPETTAAEALPAKPTDPARLREKLRRSGFAYLQRYAASQAHFRDVLGRKFRRWLEAGYIVAEPAALEAEVAAVVAEFQGLGLLDDKAFAEARVASGRRKGASRLRIAMTLRRKGVDAETAEVALAGDEGSDEEAALRFAHRRRIGPWRRDRGGDAATLRNREIAAMMRQGFGYGLARTIIDMAPDEAQARLEGNAFPD
ncbi:regulatory protein RecX [Oryzibacter oryziterrae]|uniref:regulatory protein RecX n=1 Tax=Oryzibacter oryziterrae TaxID=2766474 RepID=UPI001F23A615|nr:regulatory protein RecX [Oryzibacter oryziterrae]